MGFNNSISELSDKFPVHELLNWERIKECMHFVNLQASQAGSMTPKFHMSM